MGDASRLLLSSGGVDASRGVLIPGRGGREEENIETSGSGPIVMVVGVHDAMVVPS